MCTSCHNKVYRILAHPDVFVEVLEPQRSLLPAADCLILCTSFIEERLQVLCFSLILRVRSMPKSRSLPPAWILFFALLLQKITRGHFGKGSPVRSTTSAAL